MSKDNKMKRTMKQKVIQVLCNQNKYFLLNIKLFFFYILLAAPTNTSAQYANYDSVRLLTIDIRNHYGYCGFSYISVRELEEYLNEMEQVKRFHNLWSDTVIKEKKYLKQLEASLSKLKYVETFSDNEFKLLAARIGIKIYKDKNVLFVFIDPLLGKKIYYNNVSYNMNNEIMRFVKKSRGKVYD